MAESQTGDGGGGRPESGGDQSPRSSNVHGQDRFLPMSNISRIIKRVLSDNGQMSKDAKETMQKCVSEFIFLVTSEASEKCKKENKKTINVDDVLRAMATVGFEDYIILLTVYLKRYREMEGDNKGSGKGGESSGSQPSQVSQFSQPPQHGSFSQGPYENSQFSQPPQQGSSSQGRYENYQFPQPPQQGSSSQGRYENSQPPQHGSISKRPPI